MRKREKERERKRERERRTKSANETNVISTSDDDDDASRIFVASCRERNKKRSVTPAFPNSFEYSLSRREDNAVCGITGVVVVVIVVLFFFFFFAKNGSLYRALIQRRTPNCTKSSNTDDDVNDEAHKARLFPTPQQALLLLLLFRFCLLPGGASASGDFVER